ncbi:MAG TPA: hypothetical protein VL426_00420 [Candidatus Binatia bacterium]|jgi:hypothetical protein|nr:hypothetical protein [Candidatus Binatia bacterium]
MDFSWIDGAKRGLRRIAFGAFLILAFAGGTGFLGYVIGRSYGPARPAPAASAPGQCVPANANTREAMAKRNVVWRVWNGEVESLPESPERAIAAMLGLMLSPEANAQARNAGMRMYMQKSIAYFSADDIRAVQGLIGNGTPAQLAEALRRIATADGDAADLVRAVLADRDRVARFTDNRLPIPLETLPDGTTP